MTFGEKLFSLRKEKGFSQEALAEELSTTRQAVSKWENDQGFPETEKLLLIGNVFDVSIDYLLKERSHPKTEGEDHFYVSKEMTEGYMNYISKSAKSFALSFSLFALAFVPYLMFKGSPEVYAFPILVLATIGALAFFKSVATKDASKYEVMNKKPLLFDQSYLKELGNQYNDVRRRFMPLMAIGITFIAIAVISFMLEENSITQGVLVPYYPILVSGIAVGGYIVIRTLPQLSTYDLLVNNEEHIRKMKSKSEKKLRKILKEWI